MSHHQRTHATGHQHAGELGSGEAAQRRIEVQHAECVGAGFLQQAPALAEIGETAGRRIRGEEFLGQRLEAQHHAGQAISARQVAGPRDQCAMAQVDAVEATHRRDVAAGRGTARIEPAQQSHQCRTERR
jgi:hypothetical protein